MSTSIEPQPPAGSQAPPACPSRLYGWKEIAAWLGRGVRTAQRWEKELGLPVHRIGREGGEIVFAFGVELDRWQRERDLRDTGGGAGHEVAPTGGLAAAAPRDTARRPPAARARVAWLALALLVAPLLWLTHAALGGALPLAIAARTSRTPVSWTLEGGVFSVRAEDGTRIFEHALGFQTTPVAADPPGGGPVTIADLDGDGRPEVLLVPTALEPSRRRLYCFESDGDLRFVHQALAKARFGDVEYEAPWAAERAFVTRRASGAAGLWLASAQPGQVPARLEELGPDGRVRQEYLLDGRVTLVAEARFAGRDAVFVGATDEDMGGASVAVFDRDAVSGSAPASEAGYDCTSCAIGGPRSVLVFPRLCLTRRGELPSVAEIAVDRSELLTVATLHHREPAPLPGAPAAFRAYYSFDRALALVRAEISREFRAAHAVLERRRLVDHRYGPPDDAGLFPVRRYDGRDFAALPAVAVGH